MTSLLEIEHKYLANVASPRITLTLLKESLNPGPYVRRNSLDEAFNLFSRPSVRNKCFARNSCLAAIIGVATRYKVGYIEPTYTAYM
jgi:hypothetical protein